MSTSETCIDAPGIQGVYCEGTVPPTPKGNRDGCLTFPGLLLPVPLTTCGTWDALALEGLSGCPSTVLSPPQSPGWTWGGQVPQPQADGENPGSSPKMSSAGAQAGKAPALPSCSISWGEFLT